MLKVLVPVCLVFFLSYSAMAQESPRPIAEDSVRSKFDSIVREHPRAVYDPTNHLLLLDSAFYPSWTLFDRYHNSVHLDLVVPFFGIGFEHDITKTIEAGIGILTTGHSYGLQLDFLAHPTQSIWKIFFVEGTAGVIRLNEPNAHHLIGASLGLDNRWSFYDYDSTSSTTGYDIIFGMLLGERLLLGKHIELKTALGPSYIIGPEQYSKVILWGLSLTGKATIGYTW